jgi:hypothetical protein
MASPGDDDAANILARAIHHDAMDATLTTDPLAGGVALPTRSKKAKHQREFVPKRQIHDRKPSPVTSGPIRIPGKMLKVLYATAEGRNEINSEDGDRKPSPVTSGPIRIPGKMLNVLYATAEGQKEINSEEGGSDQSLRHGTTDPLAGGVAAPARSRKAKHQREFVLERQILARKPSPVTIVPTRIPGHNLSLLCPPPMLWGIN